MPGLELTVRIGECYFLRVGDLVVVPVYGAAQDDAACRKLEELLPGARIVPLRCEGLAREGGVLNCVSWTGRSREQPTQDAQNPATLRDARP